MNNENFLIEKTDLELAQEVCNSINSKDIRNRAVANAMGANIAVKYFEDGIYDVDTTSGLHNIPEVLEDIEISDVYLDGAYVDVRVFFNENEICVPKAHFDNDLLPKAYMFIKLNSEISGGYVMGFITPENISKEREKDGYYFINESEFVSFYDIQSELTTDANYEPVSAKDIHSYLDKTLADKNLFYKTLINSEESRVRFAQAAKASRIFKYVSVSADMAQNPTNTGDIADNDILPEINPSGISDEVLDLSEDLTASADSLDNFELDEDNTLDISDFESDMPVENMLEETDSIQPLDLSAEIEESSEISDEGIAELSESSDENDLLEEISDTDTLDNSANDLNIREELTDTVSPDSGDETLEELAEQDTINLDETLEITEEELSADNNAEYEYTTSTSPSLNEIENPVSDEILELEEIEEEEPASNTLSEDVQAESDNSNGNEELNSDEQIETLFNSDENSGSEVDDIQSEAIIQGKKSPVVPILLTAVLLAVAGAAGYFGYTKLTGLNNALTTAEVEPIAQEPAEETPIAEDAMPIETVEDSKMQTEFANEPIIPAADNIGQSIDPSVLVANLKIDWEVPAGYASNASAKKYLVKLGKVIQLNLKPELLLLSKAPVTDKVSMELKYNSGTHKFEIGGIIYSSGEKSVDTIITQTVQRVLNMNLSTSTDSFAKLQGNPVLVIHL